MKWLFLLAAIYVVLLARVPDHCDVTTFQQCTKDDIQFINRLQLKSDEELRVLIEMEKTETELVHQRYLENLSYIMNEIKLMEDKISILNTLYKEQTVNYNEKLFDLDKEYRVDLTRRILALEREKIEDDQKVLGM